MPANLRSPPLPKRLKERGTLSSTWPNKSFPGLSPTTAYGLVFELQLPTLHVSLLIAAGDTDGGLFLQLPGPLLSDVLDPSMAA